MNDDTNLGTNNISGSQSILQEEILPTERSPQPLGDAALALAAKGLRVFPCKERTKDPLIYAWPERATTDANMIRGWWRKDDFNIGIATGPGSGIWVLDLDGDADAAWLRQVEQEHGALPPTVGVISGRGDGGFHRYFRWPKDKDKKIIHNIQDRDDFPDVRGKGGYIIAPPSIHPISGREYAWSVEYSANTLADAPEWLVDLVINNSGKGSKSGNGNARGEARSPDAWRTFLGDTHDGSHRGSAIASYSGLLLRKYVDPLIVLDTVRMFNKLRCLPPLDDEDVVRIVTDITRCEQERRRCRP
jgi:hypothetical protein